MKFNKLLLLPLLALTSFTSPSKINNFKNSNAEMKTAAAQGLFSYLRCHRQAKNIVINWGTTTTGGIDHFVIYHSDDNEFFAPLAEIPVANSLKYTFKHELVFPGYHYYRIAAIMTDGPTGNSVVDVVRIVSHG